MNARSPIIIVLCILLCLLPGTSRPVAQAQGGDCPAIVQAALTATEEFCLSTGRNEACYGHFLLDAAVRDSEAGIQFAAQGDIAPVGQLESLRMFPMDINAGTWGVALMRIQANLPDSLPGQNVTMLLFGDVSLTNAVPPGTEAVLLDVTALQPADL
ncbi:MAG: hypothetical protein JW910_13045, partial [Anaerolineae bacterium]|nr:hypothetical protein [Anaerolineae bacterium]